MARSALILSAVAVSFLAALPAARAGDPPPASYDAELAAQLGGDDYGMRPYIFVLLRTGPATIEDPAHRSALFAGHFANMTRLAEEGALVLAGPLSDIGDKRGLFILNAPSIEAAKEMVAADPAVAAGLFTAEYSGYYGSAALLRLNAIHKTIQRKAIE